MNNVVILANGSFPKHEKALSVLANAQNIICCDGAIKDLDEIGIEPKIIIGDLDSISKKLQNKYKQKLIHIDNQDENDLRKAINWLENNGAAKAIILGGTGKREDHTLGNIFSLLQFPTTIELSMITNSGFFSIINKSMKLTTNKRQQISLFSIDNKIKITTKGLKYNLKDESLFSLYQGTLNETISDFISIKISHGSILIYQVF